MFLLYNFRSSFLECGNCAYFLTVFAVLSFVSARLVARLILCHYSCNGFCPDVTVMVDWA